MRVGIDLLLEFHIGIADAEQLRASEGGAVTADAHARIASALRYVAARHGGQLVR